ncbi:MAG: YgiT-type zinc finger protein [Candidatus Margulisiibacteriota bacterium]
MTETNDTATPPPADENGAEEPVTCEACGGSLKLEKINLEEFEGGKLYHMENIPAYVCLLCGETWIPEEIIHEFEKMIEFVKSRKKITKKKMPPKIAHPGHKPQKKGP